MNAEKKLKGKSNALFCVLSLVLLVVLLFPLYWILVTSLKTEQEIFRIPPTLFPSVLNTDSYAAQLQSGDFNMFQSFGNSMIIALSCTAIAVILSVPASYGLARFRFRGKKVCILSFLITQMLPVSVILTPMFIIVIKYIFLGFSGGRDDRNSLFRPDFEELFRLHSEGAGGCGEHRRL